MKNAKASPRITPKATPLQSPGAENVPLIRESAGEIIKNDGKEDVKLEDKQEEKKDQGTEKTQVINRSVWFIQLSRYFLTREFVSFVFFVNCSMR